MLTNRNARIRLRKAAQRLGMGSKVDEHIDNVDINDVVNRSDMAYDRHNTVCIYDSSNLRGESHTADDCAAEFLVMELYETWDETTPLRPGGRHPASEIRDLPDGETLRCEACQSTDVGRVGNGAGKATCRHCGSTELFTRLSSADDPTTCAGCESTDIRYGATGRGVCLVCGGTSMKARVPAS